MHLFTFVRIVEPLSGRLYIITGNIPESEIPKGKFQLKNFKIEVEMRRHLPLLAALPIWLFNFMLGQLKTTYYLIRVSRATDVVLLFNGADINLFPLLLAKLLRKRVMTMVVEYSPMSVKSVYGTSPYYLYRLLSKINRTLSDKIIVYTENVVHWAKLEKYREKVFVGSEVFIDTNLFTIKQPYHKRKNTVGYISRLSKEKGILDFVNAIPLILRKRSDIDFLIGGDGMLLPWVMEELDRNGLKEKVVLAGWIPHHELPYYMNKLKVLVVPTHTEAGSPQVIQEAMSCGTPVLATMVGGIGNVIKDGENGFALRNNSLEQIAEDILRILEHPRINTVMQNARKLIEQDYSFDAVVGNYRDILE